MEPPEAEIKLVRSAAHDGPGGVADRRIDVPGLGADVADAGAFEQESGDAKGEEQRDCPSVRCEMGRALWAEGKASDKRPSAADHKNEAKNVEGQFVREEVGSPVKVEPGIGVDRQEGGRHGEGEEPIEDHQMHRRAGFRAAGTDLALGEDELDDSAEAEGLPVDGFALLPDFDSEPDLEEHDAEAGESEKVKERLLPCRHVHELDAGGLHGNRV